jgi:hypothetical protein
MKTLENNRNNLSGNTHVRRVLYREFYHSIVYIVNEERHISFEYKIYASCSVFPVNNNANGKLQSFKSNYLTTKGSIFNIIEFTL